MTSLILKTASRFLITLLLLYSFFLLMRGHDLPGGGFVAGLVAAGAWTLFGIAHGPEAVRRSFRFDPLVISALGVLIAISSGLIALLFEKMFLHGEWILIPLSANRELKLGTPILFDLGVYLAVLGTSLTVMLTIQEEHPK